MLQSGQVEGHPCAALRGPLRGSALLLPDDSFHHRGRFHGMDRAERREYSESNRPREERSAMSVVQVVVVGIEPLRAALQWRTTNILPRWKASSSRRRRTLLRDREIRPSQNVWTALSLSSCCKNESVERIDAPVTVRAADA